MGAGSLDLVLPRNIAKHHWLSIPVEKRGFAHIASYLVSATAAGIVAFLSEGTDTTAPVGISAAAVALAGLLFALAVQIFAMTGYDTPPETEEARRDRIQDAALLRGLLANVLYSTVWATLAAVLAAAALFTSGGPATALVAVAVGAFTMALLSFFLTCRRLFGMALIRFRRALDPVPDRVHT